MPEFLLYWRPDTVDATPAGEIQFWAGSQWIGNGVKPVDALWAVTSRGPSDLQLLARIPVERVFTTRADAVKVLGERAWPHAEHFAVAPAEQCRPIQDIDLGQIGGQPTFAGDTPRLPHPFTAQASSECAS